MLFKSMNFGSTSGEKANIVLKLRGARQRMKARTGRCEGRPLNPVLLIGLALGGGVLARGLSTRVAVYLGKSSYAMYILHVPILCWCLRRSPEFPPLLYIAIVIAVSALVYGMFEEPANRRLRGFLRDPARHPPPASP
jgi:peptidoglycan/LPS O-acetylase OafA/YrhL